MPLETYIAQGKGKALLDFPEKSMECVLLLPTMDVCASVFSCHVPTLWSDDIAETPQEMVAESKLKPSIEVFLFSPTAKLYYSNSDLFLWCLF